MRNTKPTWADLAKAHGLETVRECLTKKGIYDY